ncbi:MAG: flagellar export chaperone FlgN [Myxococcota bacterium]
MSIEIGVEDLQDEIGILERLTTLLREVRGIRLDQMLLTQSLGEQAELCEVLTSRRNRRAVLLAEHGYRSQDLLVALLAGASKSEHDAIIEIFGQYVNMAEQAQSEIDINREFFSVALSAIEGALSAASPADATYELRSNKKSSGPVMFCRQI